MVNPFFILLSPFLVANFASAYWLMASENMLTMGRVDPIVSPGNVSGHVHSVVGGGNFGVKTDTAKLRESTCTSLPIPQDNSNYWFPQLYFQWSNGSFTSVSGGAVIYYLFNDKPGTTTAFPDDFRMISGNPTLRSYDASNYGQQAITFLCLDFNGSPTRHNELPSIACPSGVRSQINFPSCWDGKNTDSTDHKSHVAFPSGGPDSGTCSDPKFPVTIPRIFLEVYWGSQEFDSVRGQAMNPSQPFVFAYGDPTGYGNHADFLMGWDAGVLQNAVDHCTCDVNGDPTCCAAKGIFDLKPKDQHCRQTNSVDEKVDGTLAQLPGKNPVQPASDTHATMFVDPAPPALLSPVCAYTGDVPPADCGTVSTSSPASGNVSSPGSGSASASTSPSTTSVGADTAAPSPKPPCRLRPRGSGPGVQHKRAFRFEKRRFTPHFTPS